MPLSKSGRDDEWQSNSGKKTRKQRGYVEPGKSKFFTKEVLAKYAKIFNSGDYQGNYNDHFQSPLNDYNRQISDARRLCFEARKRRNQQEVNVQLQRIKQLQREIAQLPEKASEFIHAGINTFEKYYDWIDLHGLIVKEAEKIT